MIKPKVHNKGAAMLIFVLFFVFASSALAFLFGRAIYSDLLTLSSLGASAQSYLTAESHIEDVGYRNIGVGYSVGSVEQLVFAGATSTATTTIDTINDEKVIRAAADLQDRIRKSEVRLGLGGGVSFNYGLQSGTGGISMANSASVVGNVYSNGWLTGSKGGGNQSYIRGDVVSAGPSGRIDSIHATGTAWADTLSDSLIEGDAHYNNVDVPSTVNGNRYTPAVNQPTSSLPITDEKVEEWKQAVLDYGTVIASTSPECSSGTYTIEDSTTIGYLKVECNLDIEDKGSPATVVTVNGPVWVEGNISFTQGPTIQVDPSLGKQSAQFIADNEGDRLTSSQIEIRNSTDFAGSGATSSLVLLLSQNESAEEGGSEEAISLTQSANGDIMVYAGHGLIDIANGISLKEVTAYQINIAQNSEVVYETGLANQLFTSGPGGGYVVTDWTETY